MTTDNSPTSGVQLLEVAPDHAGQRIDNFLLARLKGVPKTLIYRILRKGEVRVNKGRIKPEYKLQAGDIVRVPPLRLAERDEPAPLLKNSLRSGERMVEVNPEGKEALTEFRVLRRFGEFATLVEASPITGRTHQIRVHAKHAGHSIAGDAKYGDEEFTREVRELGGKRLFLHAYQLKIELPDGQHLELQADVDDMWAQTLERLGA